MKLARQGKGLWVEALDKRTHPNGDSYFWHGGEWSHHEEEADSDVALLSEGYVTAVPIHIDQLTDHRFLEERKKHFDTCFEN